MEQRAWTLSDACLRDFFPVRICCFCRSHILTMKVTVRPSVGVSLHFLGSNFVFCSHLRNGFVERKAKIKAHKIHSPR